VSIVDKTVSADVELTDAVTNDRGAYSASFDATQLKERNKALPDLHARMFAGETFLGAWDVDYNVSSTETLKVVLDKSALRSVRSEHEVLAGTLTGHFAGKLRDLKETGEQQQITYLANKTGWDARAIAKPLVFQDPLTGNVVKENEFSISKAGWKDYPDIKSVPRPPGPFRLVNNQ